MPEKFAPPAGQIRGAANDLKRQAQGVPSAIQAWGELLHVPTNEKIKRATDEVDESGNTIIEVTPYPWSHPLVRKVAIMMGFPRFPDWDSESYERTAFIKAYEVELQSYLKQEAQLPEVSRFIESNSQIKQLAKGMEK